MKESYYSPGSPVVVLMPGDPYNRTRGTVESTRNVGPDTEHRVRFADGTLEVYYADELVGSQGTPSLR